ncbi:MAG: prolyl oligopeptidase family serine peptidase [Polyangiaceae bacterium]
MRTRSFMLAIGSVTLLGALVACTPKKPVRYGSFADPVPTAPVGSPQWIPPLVPTAPSTAPTYSGLGASSVAPEILAKYAPAPLATADTKRIQSMLDIRAPTAGVVSPDGKRLFFSWSVTGTSEIWRVDGPMGFPTQLTGGDDVASIVGVTPDGKQLIVSRDQNGEENPGLYLLSPDGGPLKVIQHTPKVQTFFDFVSDDSTWLLFHANDKKADQFVIYKYDLASGTKETLFDQEGLWSVADEQKGKLLLQKAVGGNQSEFYEYDPATKALTPVIGKDEREDYVVAYGAKDGEFIVLTPKLGDYKRLYSLEKGDLKPISPDIKNDVESFSIDRQRRRILYSVNESGYTKAFGIDAASKNNLPLPKLPAADHVAFGATTRNGRFTTFTIDPGKSPLESFVYDWNTTELKKWHKPSSPEIDTSTFAQATLESFPARDGTSVPMFVRRPAKCASPSSADPCPVIVSFHGGPEGQALPGFSTRAQLFVDAGFVYVEPNVRGSSGYGKKWIHADDGAKRLDVITDIDDVAQFIRTKWAANGKAPKIGIYGGSYGGYSTLVGMTLFAGDYDAGVSVVGISNLETFLLNTAPYRRALRISEYGDPEKDKEALAKLSPFNFVDRVKAPLMLIQGATDPRVPVGEAVQFHDKLAARPGADTPLIIFPDEGHGMRKRANQVLQLGHTLKFFERTLK